MAPVWATPPQDRRQMDLVIWVLPLSLLGWLQLLCLPLLSWTQQRLCPKYRAQCLIKHENHLQLVTQVWIAHVIVLSSRNGMIKMLFASKATEHGRWCCRVLSGLMTHRKPQVPEMSVHRPVSRSSLQTWTSLFLTFTYFLNCYLFYFPCILYPLILLGNLSPSWTTKVLEALG